MKAAPLITIITPSLNRASMIIAAVESVRLQDYVPVEHIIVDGGSTDGTLEKLANYPHLSLTRGPDQGIYDGLNKGLRAAQGEVIGFLNSDDFYAERVFGSVVELFEKTSVDAVAGQASLFVEKKDHTKRVFRRTRLLTEQNLWRELTYGDPAFNSWFFHRRVFDKIGNFDIAYRFVADRDFLLRFAVSDLTCAPLEKVVYSYRSHDESMTFSRNLWGFSDIADENLRLVDHYLALIPRHARLDMQRVRTRDTITAASRNLRSGAYEKALYYVRLGCRYDPFWPVKFFFQIFTGIFRVIGRRLGIYPPI